MKKLLTTILISFCIGLPLLAQVQDSIGPPLLITEWSRNGGAANHYYELTNMADTAIDLSEFAIHRCINGQIVGQYPHSNDYRSRMDFDDIFATGEKIVEPGECVTIMPLYERYNTNEDNFFYAKNVTRIPFRDSADILSYMSEPAWDDEEFRIERGLPEDSVDTYLLHRYNHGESVYIYWRDTIPCDAITNVLGPNGGAANWRMDYPVAGIGFPQDNYTMVRKFNRNAGSFDWHISRGIDASDSWWIPIFYDWNNPWNPSFFTTIGVHGDFSIDFSSERLTIDHTAKTIKVPWGIRKGTWNVALNTSKGIVNEIDFGPGMAYRYIENSDTASSACMLGDTLWVYATGNDLESAAYAIIPEEAKASDAMVLSKRTKNVDGIYITDVGNASSQSTALSGSNLYQMQCRFHVTENGEGADTISWIPFAERKDTLYKYLEEAPNATWEIDWVDGLERVDLKEGDKLVVTAGDGSTQKEYYLKLRPLVKSDNSSLSAITWPDVEEDFWDSDTLPGFSPTKLQYNIEVPYGSKNIPALHYYKADVNAKAEMKRATSLTGSLEERTSTITVISYSSLDTTVYKVVFKAEIRAEDIQPFFAEPIITEYVYRLWQRMSLLEIANVGNQPLDLGKYLFVGSDLSPANAIQALNGTDSATVWRYRYNKYIPGKKYSTYKHWAEGPGRVVDDPDMLPILEPGEFFVMANLRSQSHDPSNGWYIDPMHYDVQWSGSDYENQWGEEQIGWFDCQLLANTSSSNYIFKIVGDSVLDGTKGLYDPEDFELIDGWGDFADGGGVSWDLGGIPMPSSRGVSFKRKPDNYYPATIPTVGWDDPQKEGWTMTLAPDVGGAANQVNDLRNFTHDPITEYMSTVSSTVYLVDDGYEGDLSIVGVLSGTTSASFITNLILMHPDQDLSVISSSTGLVLGDDDPLAAGDTLKVISADGKNITRYTVELGALDSNATLLSDVYTIDVDGAEGSVSGIPVGTTIEDVLDNVDVPALAILSIIDADGNLVALQALDMKDSTYRKVMLMGDVYFEVIAQDGTTITYLLDQGILSSDAWVSSNVYTVNQENRTIADILEGTSVDILLSNLVPSGNALMVVYDKAGFKRDSGTVAMDDVVGVTSEDGSKTVTYSLRNLGYVASSAAWVKSNIYTVNETTSSVDDIPVNTDVSEFLSNVEVPGGAYLKLMDADDAEKAEGVILGTDKLEVTSEDLSTVVVYTLNLLVSVHDWALVNMKVYPNPVSDLLHIEGLEGKCQIELITMSGQKLRAVQTSDPVCNLSVSSLSAGMYILRVADKYLNMKVLQVVKSE